VYPEKVSIEIVTLYLAKTVHTFAFSYSKTSRQSNGIGGRKLAVTVMRDGWRYQPLRSYFAFFRKKCRTTQFGLLYVLVARAGTDLPTQQHKIF